MLMIRKVVGSSMLPKLKPGSLIIAMKRPHSLSSGQMVVIDHNGKEKIKRIVRVKHQVIYVLGDNPENSTDSRHFGWINDKSVIAKVIWPRP